MLPPPPPLLLLLLLLLLYPPLFTPGKSRGALNGGDCQTPSARLLAPVVVDDIRPRGTRRVRHLVAASAAAGAGGAANDTLTGSEPSGLR